MLYNEELAEACEYAGIQMLRASKALTVSGHGIDVIDNHGVQLRRP